MSTLQMSQRIEHTGIINHIDGNHIQVVIQQNSACSVCHAKDACVSSEKAEKVIEVESQDTSLHVGDMVMLSGRNSTGLLAVLLAFVIPFIIILLTLLVSRYYVDSEAVSGVLALAVLIPYFITLSFFNDKMKSKFRFSIERLAPAMDVAGMNEGKCFE